MQELPYLRLLDEIISRSFISVYQQIKNLVRDFANCNTVSSHGIFVLFLFEIEQFDRTHYVH